MTASTLAVDGLKTPQDLFRQTVFNRYGHIDGYYLFGKENEI